MAISREQLLRPVPVEKEKVFIPELDDHVWVKGMTAAGRSKFERQFQTSTGKSNKRKVAEIRERMVVACCCTEDGTQLFAEDDIEVIGKQPIAMIERIVNVAQRLCGMSNEDVELMAKNSEEIDGAS